MFGVTTCGKCGNSGFKLQEVSVSGSNFRMFAIQCVSCGVPIGITEYYDAGDLLKEQEKKLIAMEGRLTRIESYLQQLSQQVAQALRR
jgi:predicted nucleic-acid-binding Zn-ribbon protein